MGQVVQDVPTFRLNVWLIKIDFTGPPKDRQQSTNGKIIFFVCIVVGTVAIGNGVLLKAFEQTSMVSQYGRTFGLGRVCGQDQLHTHVRQFLCNLFGTPTLVFELPQGIAPKCRQGIDTRLFLDRFSEDVGRVLFRHPE